MMNLAAISRLIAGQALQMSGTDIKWYKAIFCPYVRPDGSPCYDEVAGSPWVGCPICQGTGVTYASPRIVKGVYTDNSNKYVRSPDGGFMLGSKTLSLPVGLDIRILKPRNNSSPRRFLRDKFELLGQCCNPDGSRDVLEVLYLDDADPVKPTVSSTHIYQIVQVVDNY